MREPVGVVYEGSLRGTTWQDFEGELGVRIESGRATLTDEQLRAALARRAGDFQHPVEFEVIERKTEERELLVSSDGNEWTETTKVRCRRRKGSIP